MSEAAQQLRREREIGRAFFAGRGQDIEGVPFAGLDPPSLRRGLTCTPRPGPDRVRGALCAPPVAEAAQLLRR